MSEKDLEADSDSKRQAPVAPGAPANGKSTTPAPGTEAVDSAAGTVAAKKLTKEEQMALYEESLKEEDWGHQPC